ncbi:unnamed protein product [Prunus armeniaca]
MALQYIASFNEKGTTIVVRTLLDDRVEHALKELCLRHNGTSAGTNIPVAATCLDGLLTAMERVGDGALMLYRLGMRAFFANGLGCCKRWTEEIAPFRLGSKIKPQNTSKGQRNLRRYFELSMSGMRHGEQNQHGEREKERQGSSSSYQKNKLEKKMNSARI